MLDVCTIGCMANPAVCNAVVVTTGHFKGIYETHITAFTMSSRTVQRLRPYHANEVVARLLCLRLVSHAHAHVAVVPSSSPSPAHPQNQAVRIYVFCIVMTAR